MYVAHSSSLRHVVARAAQTLLTTLTLFSTCQAATATGTTATLIPLASNIAPPRLNIELDGPDWHWLGIKRELRVGIYHPNSNPFQFTPAKGLEGINADYIKIIAYNLGLIPVISQYPDRDSALKGLLDGSIDMVDDVAGTAPDDRFLRTQPYLSNPVTLVTRQHPPPASLDGMRIGVNPRLSPANAAHQERNGVQWTSYGSPWQGLSAVAYKQVDAFLGDPVSISYYLAAGTFDKLYVWKRPDLGTRANIYTLKSTDFRLRSILDQTLASIPDYVQQNIIYRWGLPTASFVPRPSPQFTGRELRWMQRHPVVRVVALNVFPPYSMHVENSTDMSGLSIDMLRRLSQITGLDFKISGMDTTKEIQAALLNGDADMIAGLFWSEAREEIVDFSDPYVTSGLVMVGRSDGVPLDADNRNAGKRIAVVRDSDNSSVVLSAYPNAKLIETASPNDSLLAVVNGQADFAVQSQLAANFYLRNYFRDELAIMGVLGTEDSAAEMAFAFSRNQDELKGILNKALASLPVDEQVYLLNSWRAQSPPYINTWYAYRNEVYLLIAAGTISAIGLLAWILYLRQQVQKRRRAERALNDQLSFMRTLIDGIPNPVFVRDLDGRMLTCNRSYLDAFSVTMEDVRGRTLPETPAGLENIEQSQRAHEQYLEAMQSPEGAIFQDVELKLHGQNYYIYHWLLPFTDSLGRVAGLIGGWIDLTERTKLLHELHEAKEEADTANRAKSNFLATMSHEIRTPMNAIMGMLELVLRRPAGQDIDRGALTVAYDSSRALLELIGDILDISKIEAEKFELNPHPTNLRRLMEGVVHVFDGMATQKKLKLVFQCQLETDNDVMLDSNRLRQVVSNLVSNALKFTERGEVVLTLSVMPDADDRARIDIAVDDSGPGINASDRRRLFEPFTQIHQECQHEQAPISGTGLGLAISRRIVDTMEGTFDLSSIPGKGTRIDIHLSAPMLDSCSYQARESLPTYDSDTPPRSLDVLVIDDHPPNRLLLTHQLNFIGHAAQAASDGRQGLAMWTERPYDVVLTDCNMPGMSGYDVARAIRHLEAEQGRPHTVIYAVTASAQAEEEERCKAAGMDGCLFKPLDIETLRQQLSGLGSAAAEQDADIPASFLPQQLTELTCDDPELTQRIVEELIKANREDVINLVQAATVQDLMSIADLAHRIAGGARVVAAHPVIDQALALEDATRGGRMEVDTLQAVNQLVAAIQALEADLLSWVTGRYPPK